MKIDKFEGEYRFLSNFWPAVVWFDMVEYPTVEHAYQAAKFPINMMVGKTGMHDKIRENMTVRELIRLAPTPGMAKKYGRMWRPRSDWDSVKLIIMENLVTQKFQRPDLIAQLRWTGNAELIEGNTWGDTFWGMVNGKGDNHLGKILMNIRNHHQGEYTMK